MKWTMSLTGVVLATCAHTLFAATYYIGPNGSDSRSSSQARNRSTPWRSIQRGLDTARGGDAVIVLNGNYNEDVRFRRSGSQGNVISLLAENPLGASITGSVASYGFHHLAIDGFRVTNPDGRSGSSKGMSFNDGHHITIRRNEVSRCYGGGISVDRSDFVLIEWNATWQNAFWDQSQHSGISIYQARTRTADSTDTSSFGIIIRNNTSFENENKVPNPSFGRATDGNGIIIDDGLNSQGGGGAPYSRGTLIENNLCYSNGGQGIHCYKSEDVVIKNNTCVNNLKSFDFGGEVSVVQSFDVSVFNNILSARGGRFVNLQYASSNVWWDYNILHNGTSRDVTNASHTIYANPQFASGSFKVTSNSPAVDSGILFPGGIFGLDVSGGQRVIGATIDIGADEFAFND